MKLPNLSYMMSVGELRYIQSHFEKGEDRNPDSAVGMFLPLSKRIRCVLRGTVFLARVRSNPFYYYVNARTKYYDEVFLDAIRSSFKHIINLGCGSDTRAYRFADLLREKGIVVLECDQGEAIRAKEHIARRKSSTTQVRYLSIDLDVGNWPSLAGYLDDNAKGSMLVMLEGVSPYIGEASFKTFLQLLAHKLHPGSVVAYDFKLRGVADEFGGSNKAQPRFRLPGDEPEVAAFHRAIGLELKHMELSTGLLQRFHPGAATSFQEDCLVRLSIARPINS
jgi:methyltransferase (TIGR00027 family)